MKKTLLALTLAAVSGGASADTILGIYAGGGNWMASYDGEVGDTGYDSMEVDDLSLEDSDNLFFYAALEHPIPLIPNVRVAHTSVQVEGQAQLTQQFTFEGETYSQGEEVATDLDMSHLDGTLYYELLDNWVSLDVGLTARKFDGYVEVSDPDDASRTERLELSEVIPMGYGKAQVELPLTGWHLAGSANYVGYNGDSFSDLDVKFGYQTDGFVLDFGLDIGYRQMSLDVSDGEDLQADLNIGGPYIEAMVHF